MCQPELKYGDLAMVRVLTCPDPTPQLARFEPIWAGDGWEFFGTACSASTDEVEIVKRVCMTEEI